MVKGDAHFFMKQLTEMRRVVIGVFGNLRQGDFFLEMQADIFERLLQFTLLRQRIYVFLIDKVCHKQFNQVVADVADKIGRNVRG